ncbi:MAG: ornithine cyclodeaminase [Rubellimicrobium sp.]|nr:ornithine cyclodeaminase [Rubellimicrobium sp.]
MTAPVIPRDAGEEGLDWLDLTRAIAAGHDLPLAQVDDVLLRRGNDALLNRSAWIEGLGIAVKVATVFPGNAAQGGETLGGAVVLCSDRDGQLEAVLDFHLVTKWKTAGDSLLAATLLARPDSRNILIVGAGAQGRNLLDAYRAAFPQARFTVWNRSRAGAERFAADRPGTAIAGDLEQAVRAADIITCATMAQEPLIRGDWLGPGQHLDLVGAYTPAMREADDRAIARGRLFVDSRATTVNHIGEIMAPIASGAITADHIIADYYDLASFRRKSGDDITVFKNGGGAHLDLMVSRYILGVWQRRHG